MKACLMCGEAGEPLDEIAKLAIQAYGHIPLVDVVALWYKQGYSPNDVVCPECLLK
jgi:hypothetical protein